MPKLLFAKHNINTCMSFLHLEHKYVTQIMLQ